MIRFICVNCCFFLLTPLFSEESLPESLDNSPPEEMNEHAKKTDQIIGTRIHDHPHEASWLPAWLTRPSHSYYGRSPTAELHDQPNYRLGGYASLGYGLVDRDDDQKGRLEGLTTEVGIDAAVRIADDFTVASSVSLQAYREHVDYDDFDDRLDVDELFLRWTPGSLVITAGRTRQWFGWERYNAPELWRVNPSYTYYNSGSLDGLSIGYQFDDGWLLQVGVADEIITPRNNSEGKGSTDFGYALKLQKTTDYGLTWDISAFHDTETAPDIVHGDFDSVTVLSSWLEWRHINESNWSIAGDIAYSHNPNGGQFFALAAVRRDGHCIVPHFVSLMVTSLVERYDESATSSTTNLYDNERYEVALSAFAFPTSDPGLRLGVELQTLQSTAFNEDELGAFFQVVASF